jgi:hypothetical protein
MDPLPAEEAANGALCDETQGLAEMFDAYDEVREGLRAGAADRPPQDGGDVATLPAVFDGDGKDAVVAGQVILSGAVTWYAVVTFEGRVILAHDMETCLAKLDEFSRQLIARHILQEHDRWATARLLHCNEKTVRRLTPFVLDRSSQVHVRGGGSVSASDGEQATQAEDCWAKTLLDRLNIPRKTAEDETYDEPAGTADANEEKNSDGVSDKAETDTAESDFADGVADRQSGRV